jgi:coproporphyrinogen III oxidase
MMIVDTIQERTEQTLQAAQQTICQALAAIDSTPFHTHTWERPHVGGGVGYVLQDGTVFERAAVSTSTLRSVMSVETARYLAVDIDLDLHAETYPYFATGLSLIIHPQNPLVPTVHANYRYFELTVAPDAPLWWFGGGADLTPCYLFADDAAHFHQVHKQVCDRYDSTFYPRFKQSCDTYFYLPHRREHRGIGGIRFSNLNDRGAEELLAFVSECAAAFVPAYVPIAERRAQLPYTPEQKRWQQVRRGRYVEFNLIYDRGTAFGLQSGVDMRLTSLPPVVCWEYNAYPDHDSPEERLLDVLYSPREWA